LLLILAAEREDEVQPVGAEAKLYLGTGASDERVVKRVM
jgi:hypothetical protein